MSFRDWVGDHHRTLQALAAAVAIIAAVLKFYPYMFAWFAGPMFATYDAFLVADYRGFVRDYVAQGGPKALDKISAIKQKWAADTFKPGQKFAGVGEWETFHNRCIYDKLVVRLVDSTGQQYPIIFLPEGEAKDYGIGRFYEGIPMQIPDYVPPGAYKHVSYIVSNCFGLFKDYRWPELPLTIVEE